MSEEKNTNLFSNAKLSTIFLVVLGLHIVVIVLISGYHLLKGDTTMEMADKMDPPVPSSYESVFAGDSGETSPQLETAFKRGNEAGGTRTSSMPPMSMPAADDPIWTGDSPVSRNSTPLAGGYESDLPEPVFETVEPAKPELKRPEPQIQSPVAVKPPSETSIYTVQRGDTLSGIAAKTGMSITALKKMNGLDSTLIRVGQKLQVSGDVAGGAGQTAVVQAPPRAQPVATTAQYRVSKGDTLWRIARKFETTPQELARMNGIADPSRLRVGDTLKVPSVSVGNPTQETDMAMAP